MGSLLRYAVIAEPHRDPLEVRLDEAYRLGLLVLGDLIDRWREPGYVERTGERAERYGITLEPTWFDYLASPDSSKLRPLDEFAVFVDHVCRPLRIPVVGVVVRGCNRFVKHPPLDEQIDLIAERLVPLADVACQGNVVIALENHADYRSAEIVRILQKTDRPNLGCRLDTGNSFTLGEDPVDAAFALAPFTYTTHLKDMFIYPVGRAEGVRVPHQTGAPLGQGHVDLLKIVHLLAERAPSPAKLPLNIEIDWIPEDQNLREWAWQSIDYCRRAFATYLPPGHTTHFEGGH